MNVSQVRATDSLFEKGHALVARDPDQILWQQRGRGYRLVDIVAGQERKKPRVLAQLARDRQSRRAHSEVRDVRERIGIGTVVDEDDDVGQREFLRVAKDLALVVGPKLLKL